MVRPFPCPPAEDFADQLTKFFASWTQYAQFSEEVNANSQTIDSKDLYDFFVVLAPAIDEFHRSGPFVNIWKIAGLGCDELRNSKILSWFMDQTAEHGLKTTVLTALVSHLNARSSTEIRDFPTSAQIINANYSTIVESCPFGDKESRIDIEIDGEKFLLFIEVKIYAAETGNQLDRYVNLARKKSNGRPWGVIYLTPKGRAPSEIHGKDRPALICNQLLCISWAEVSSVLLSAVRTIRPGLVRAMVTQYAKFIKTF